MKLFLLLSMKNIKAYKKFYIKFIGVLVCLLFIFSLFALYSISLVDKQNLMKTQSISANYFYSMEQINLDEIKEKSQNFTMKRYDFSNRTGDYFNSLHQELPMALVKLNIQSKSYVCTDYSPIQFYSNDNNQLFMSNDYKEMKVKNNQDNILKGNMPNAENEIVISEKMLKIYGLYNNVLGEVISLTSRVNGVEIIKNLKVVGIISEDYYELSGHLFVPSFTPVIFTHKDNNLFRDVQNVENTYIYSFDEWLSSETIEKIQSEQVAYVGSYIINQIKDIATMQEITGKMFLIIGCALAIGLLLVVYLMITKYIEIFSRNSGILLTCGASKKTINKLLFLQLFIIGLISSVIAIIFTLIAFFVLNILIIQIYSINLNLSLWLLFSLFALGMISIFAITSAMYFYTLLKLKDKCVKDFLIS